MSIENGAGGVYIQLSSSVNQQPKNQEPQAVTFNCQDFVSSISHSLDKDSQNIVVEEDGAYFICASGQAGRDSGKEMRFVDLWLRVNGKDLPNSNVRYGAPSNLFAGDTLVLVSQSIVPMKKGDVLNVMLSVNGAEAGLGLIVIEPKGEPRIPSIIFSMYKI